MDRDDFEALIAGLESQGMTKTAIARYAGLSYATVWRLANGGCKDHYSGTIDRLEDLLQRSIAGKQKSLVKK